MLSKYRSKSRMGLDCPLEKFEWWPDGTYSFCPRCGLDLFELLFRTDNSAYIKCSVCGAQWIADSHSRVCLESTAP